MIDNSIQNILKKGYFVYQIENEYYYSTLYIKKSCRKKLVYLVTHIQTNQSIPKILDLANDITLNDDIGSNPYINTKLTSYDGIYIFSPPYNNNCFDPCGAECIDKNGDKSSCYASYSATLFDCKQQCAKIGKKCDGITIGYDPKYFIKDSNMLYTSIATTRANVNCYFRTNIIINKCQSGGTVPNGSGAPFYTYIKQKKKLSSIADKLDEYNSWYSSSNYTLLSIAGMYTPSNESFINYSSSQPNWINVVPSDKYFHKYLTQFNPDLLNNITFATKEQVNDLKEHNLANMGQTGGGPGTEPLKWLNAGFGCGNVISDTSAITNVLSKLINYDISLGFSNSSDNTNFINQYIIWNKGGDPEVQKNNMQNAFLRSEANGIYFPLKSNPAYSVGLVNYDDLEYSTVPDTDVNALHLNLNYTRCFSGGHFQRYNNKQFPQIGHAGATYNIQSCIRAGKTTNGYSIAISSVHNLSWGFGETHTPLGINQLVLNYLLFVYANVSSVDEKNINLDIKTIINFCLKKIYSSPTPVPEYITSDIYQLSTSIKITGPVDNKTSYQQTFVVNCKWKNITTQSNISIAEPETSLYKFSWGSGASKLITGLNAIAMVISTKNLEESHTANDIWNTLGTTPVNDYINQSNLTDYNLGTKSTSSFSQLFKTITTNIIDPKYLTIKRLIYMQSSLNDFDSNPSLSTICNAPSDITSDITSDNYTNLYDIKCQTLVARKCPSGQCEDCHHSDATWAPMGKINNHPETPPGPFEWIQMAYICSKPYTL